jgi:VanZ family protein
MQGQAEREALGQGNTRGGIRAGAVGLVVGLLGAMAFFTLAPMSLRPRTGALYGYEHFIAFGLVGGAFALVGLHRSLKAALAVVGAIVLIEVVQGFVPGRHAEVSDVAMNVVGFVGGCIVGIVARRVVSRLWRAHGSGT